MNIHGMRPTACVCEKDTLIATLPIGYNNGIFRDFNNKAQVLIHGKRCTVTGSISMNMVTVAVTHLENDNVKIGDPVVLLGKQGDRQVTMFELAKIANINADEMDCYW